MGARSVANLRHSVWRYRSSCLLVGFGVGATIAFLECTPLRATLGGCERGVSDGSARSGASSAREPLFELRDDQLPAEESAAACMAASAADVDADGDVDLVLAVEFGPNAVLINDGQGRFRPAAGLPRDERDSEDAAVADFDADGDADIVFVDEDGGLGEYWINEGSLGWRPSRHRLPRAGVSNGVLAIEVDGKRGPDLIIANDGPNLVFINDGRGIFRDETAARFPADNSAVTQDLEAADVDRDGDLDLVWANEGQDQLWLNDGEGVYQDVTATHLPQFDDETREVESGDVDGDGDLDLVFANISLFDVWADPRDHLLVNDGSGRFSLHAEAFREDASNTTDAELVDITKDGVLDLITANWCGLKAGEVRLFVGQGGGVFRPAPELIPPILAAALDVEVADFNGDGELDLFVCSRGALLGKDGRLDHLLIRR